MAGNTSSVRGIPINTEPLTEMDSTTQSILGIHGDIMKWEENNFYHIF